MIFYHLKNLRRKNYFYLYDKPYYYDLFQLKFKLLHTDYATIYRELFEDKSSYLSLLPIQLITNIFFKSIIPPLKVGDIIQRDPRRIDKFSEFIGITFEVFKVSETVPKIIPDNIIIGDDCDDYSDMIVDENDNIYSIHNRDPKPIFYLGLSIYNTYTRKYYNCIYNNFMELLVNNSIITSWNKNL